LLQAAQWLGTRADFVVITANSPYVLQDQLEEAAGRPVLSMIEVTLAEIRQRGWQRIGVLGFREVSVYTEPLRRVHLTPETIEAGLHATLDASILALMEGRVSAESTATARGPEREPPVSEATIKAQVAALVAWSQGKGSAFPRLGEITQPVLVANGHNDVMVPTINSFTMAQKIKNATLIVYPDSGHGFLFQYPGAFTQLCWISSRKQAEKRRKPCIKASIFRTRSPC
jgi:pimeloyl-ACP methyl ester carboxylesterase